MRSEPRPPDSRPPGERERPEDESQWDWLSGMFVALIVVVVVGIALLIWPRHPFPFAEP